MKKEVLVSAKTIELAVELGAKELGMDKDDVTYEIIEMAKKGFLGIGSTDAKIKVSGKFSDSDVAVGFLEKIIGHMKINAMPKVIEETDGEIKIDIIGDHLGTLIGYHGEILDALQYLTYLAVNKGEEMGGDDKANSVKISLDIENYRKKREETLRQLAKKMADRVQKYGKPVTLEPMNAYERRIIHSTIQDIDGVSTHSVGQENERKIIVTKDGAAPFKPSFPVKRPRVPYGGGDGRSYGKNRDTNFKK